VGFAPISIEEYARKHVKSNPSEREADVIKALRSALAAYRAGKRCHCGNPIWVIGSAGAGHSCSTCITGEAVPDHDYEIAGACDKWESP